MRIIGGRAFHFVDPTYVAFSGGDAFVTNAFGYGVTEFSTATGAFVRVIGGPTYNFDGAFAIVTSRGDALVTNVIGKTVTEFSTKSGAFVRTIGVGSVPVGYMATWHGNAFFVTGNAVSEVSVKSGSSVRTIGGDAFHFDGANAIAIAGGDAYVTNASGN